MRIVVESGAGWPLFGAQSPSGDGSGFNAEHSQSGTAQIALQYEAVVTCTEDDAVVLGVRHVPYVSFFGVG